MGMLGPHPFDGGVVDALETHYRPTSVIPNFVALGQTVFAYHGWEIFDILRTFNAPLRELSLEFCNGGR